MGRKNAGLRSDKAERVGSCLSMGDTIDPIIDQWLQHLVKVAVAIAARESAETGDKDGGSNDT